MRKLLLITLAFILLSSPLSEAQQTRIFITYDSESLTVSTSSVPFTSARILSTTVTTNRAELATFVVECATTSPCPVRILTTGTAPTSTIGMKLNEGDSVKVFGYDDINNFRAIRSGANDALLQVQYSR